MTKSLAVKAVALKFWTLLGVGVDVPLATRAAYMVVHRNVSAVLAPELTEEEAAEIPASRHMAGVGIDGEMPWDVAPFAYPFFTDSPPETPHGGDQPHGGGQPLPAFPGIASRLAAAREQATRRPSNEAAARSVVAVNVEMAAAPARAPRE